MSHSSNRPTQRGACRALFIACVALIGLNACASKAPDKTAVANPKHAAEMMKPDLTPNLKPYPAPEAGMQRWVITLPKLANASPNSENAAAKTQKVELVIGQTKLVDCNLHRFSGNLTRLPAPGWGYDYYVLDKVFGPATTRMACPPEQAASERFIAVNLMPENIAWLPYNDQLPIVVYLPEGFTLQYRLWHAAPRLEPALVQ